MGNIRPWWVISDPDFKPPQGEAMALDDPQSDVPEWAQALHERVAAMEAKLESFMREHALPVEPPHDPSSEAAA